ncbi:MAG: hypothetical protein ABIU11_04495, partial [Chitinophagaceae bacterium]
MRKAILFPSRILIVVVLLPFLSPAQVTSGVQKMAAFKKQQQMIQQSPYKNIQWRLAGPGNISGRSTDVVGVTGNPNIIYAAFATGGLWKTENGGDNWTSLF